MRPIWPCSRRKSGRSAAPLTSLFCPKCSKSPACFYLLFFPSISRPASITRPFILSASFPSSASPSLAAVMAKQHKAKKPEILGKGKVTPVQIAFIVDRYLADNNYTATLSAFRAEASDLFSKTKGKEVRPLIQSLSLSLSPSPTPRSIFSFTSSCFSRSGVSIRWIVLMTAIDRCRKGCWAWGRFWTST